MKLMAGRAHEKGLELTCRIRPDVPDALVGDAGRLRQVILNLVGNAIKFTDGRRRRRRRRARARRPTAEAALRFTVADTGIGIAAGASSGRSSVPSSRPTRRRRGVSAAPGSGLTISAQLVELMGGRIWLTASRARAAVPLRPRLRRSADAGRRRRPSGRRRAARPAGARRRRQRRPRRRVLDDGAGELGHGADGASTRRREAMAALGAAADAGAPIPLALIDARDARASTASRSDAADGRPTPRSAALKVIMLTCRPGRRRGRSAGAPTRSSSPS